MKSLLRTSVLVLAGALMLAQTVTPALAAGAYSAVQPDRNRHSWTAYGDVYQNGALTILSERGEEREYVYKDFDLTGMRGDFIVLMALTKAPKVRENGDITGLPYVYGYLFGEDGKIDTYMQGQQMRHRATADNQWVVSYGIFRRSEGQDRVRMFLNQASRRGTYKDGREAIFYAPNLMLAETYSDAFEAVRTTEQGLLGDAEYYYQRMRPSSPAVTNTPSYSSGQDFRYALVKLPDSPAIWLVNYTKGTRHVFVNEEIYKTYDPTWVRFVEVSSSWLQHYQEDLPALPIHVHVRAEGDDTVWWSTGQSLARPHPATVQRVMQLPSWYQQLYNM